MPVLIADSSSSSVPHLPDVNVWVGDQNKHYVVPRNLLSTNSRYLEQSMNKPEPNLYLPTDVPLTFDLLLRWIQEGRRSLDLLEEEILSRVDQEKLLGDSCHYLCDLYCLWSKLELTKDSSELVLKIFNLLRHGHGLPLQPRTIRTVVEKLPPVSMILDHLLKEAADDLLEETGHGYDYYAELLEGPNAVPGLVKALFIRMRQPRYRGPQHRKPTETMLPKNEHGARNP